MFGKAHGEFAESAFMFDFVLLMFVFSFKIFFQVQSLTLFQMETKRHVCNMHVDCSIAFSAEWQGYIIFLCPGVLY